MTKTAGGAPADDDERLGRAISRAALDAGLTVGVAESLTGGMLSSLLAKAPDAAQWFRGGVVAYNTEVKQSLLGVSPGPVVTAECAQEMAVGAARVLGADIVVATTGVGGPDPEEGQPAGTVWFGVFDGDKVRALQEQFDGDPAAVCRQSALTALELILGSLPASERVAS
jgi:nicotinamide-nucleotide amidase